MNHLRAKACKLSLKLATCVHNCGLQVAAAAVGVIAARQVVAASPDLPLYLRYSSQLPTKLLTRETKSASFYINAAVLLTYAHGGAQCLFPENLATLFSATQLRLTGSAGAPGWPQVASRKSQVAKHEWQVASRKLQLLAGWRNSACLVECCWQRY